MCGVGERGERFIDRKREREEGISKNRKIGKKKCMCSQERSCLQYLFVATCCMALFFIL